jgi:hypothetical protein
MVSPPFPTIHALARLNIVRAIHVLDFPVLSLHSNKNKRVALLRISGPKGGSRSKATHSPPLDQAPFSLAVRQQPLILKSMRNTTPPVRPRIGGIA